MSYADYKKRSCEGFDNMRDAKADPVNKEDPASRDKNEHEDTVDTKKCDERPPCGKPGTKTPNESKEKYNEDETGTEEKLPPCQLLAFLQSALGFPTDRTLVSSLTNHTVQINLQDEITCLLEFFFEFSD